MVGLNWLALRWTAIVNAESDGCVVHDVRYALRRFLRLVVADEDVVFGSNEARLEESRA